MADAVFESMLYSTCEIWRPTKTSASNLTQTVAYVLVSSSSACRLNPIKSDLRMASAGVIPDYDHKCWLKNTEDIADNDVVYLLSGSLAGTYVVKGIHPQSDGNSVHHFSIYLKRRDMGNFAWSLNFSDPGNSFYLPAIM